MEDMNRVVGGLLYQAVADSVSRSFEFEMFPDPDRVRLLYRQGNLSITDDTQMALFGFEAVANGNCSTEGMKKAWSDWHTTQTKTFAPAKELYGTLLQFRSLYEKVSPEKTSLEAARTGEPEHEARGRGPVSRMLPFAFAHLFGGERDNACFLNSRSTHLSTNVEEATAIYLEVVDCILEGGQSAVQEYLKGLVPQCSFIERDITHIGGGWQATDCVLMAAWAYCMAEDFEELLTLAVCQPGNSNSVAAVAGAFWGIEQGLPDDTLTGRLTEAGPINYCIRLWKERAYATGAHIQG